MVMGSFSFPGGNCNKVSDSFSDGMIDLGKKYQSVDSLILRQDVFWEIYNYLFVMKMPLERPPVGVFCKNEGGASGTSSTK